MKRATSILCTIIVVVGGCALTDAGVFGPSVEQQREALLACGIRIALPFCIGQTEDESLPAWQRIGVSSDGLSCIEELGCGARNLDDADVASDTRADVFDCVGTADPGQFAPTTDDVRDCQQRCQNTLDLFACDDSTLLESEELVRLLEAHDECVADCERRFGV